MGAGVTLGSGSEISEGDSPHDYKKPQTEILKTPKKEGMRAETVARVIGTIVIAGIVVVAVGAYDGGEKDGKHSRDQEVENLQKLNHAQDWVIDNDITNISKDNGVYEQGGNIYIRFEDKNCKNPVAFQFDEQQNAAVLNQTDQAGNIYSSAKITNAETARTVVGDICS